MGLAVWGAGLVMLALSQSLVAVGDQLVSLANGQIPDHTRTTECLGRYFRPPSGPTGTSRRAT
jgi:hypothetical protein